MRLSFVLAGLCALSLFTGCGGPAAAKYFKIAVDASGMGKINRTESPTCFVDPTANQGFTSTKSSSTNNPVEVEWTLWDGTDGTLYLEVSASPATTVTYSLGDAPAIRVGGMIEGDSKTLKFDTKTTTVRHTDMSPAAIKFDETSVTEAAITFKDLSQTTTGTIALSSSYTCSASAGQCPDPKSNSQGKGTCQVSLPFVARQVPVTELHAFGN